MERKLTSLVLQTTFITDDAILWKKLLGYAFSSFHLEIHVLTLF